MSAAESNNADYTGAAYTVEYESNGAECTDIAYIKRYRDKRYQFY